MYASLVLKIFKNMNARTFKMPHRFIKNVFLNGWKGAILVLNVDRLFRIFFSKLHKLWF